MHTSKHRPESPDGTRDRFAYGASGRVLGEEVEATRQSTSHPSNVFSQLTHFGVDLITLGELQGELLRVDSQDAARQLAWPLILFVIGLSFLVGCFPLAMFGLAWWLASTTELTLAGASLLVAGGGTVIAALVFYGAWNWLTRVTEYFKRSREEFGRNLNWVKRTLAQRH